MRRAAIDWMLEWSHRHNLALSVQARAELLQALSTESARLAALEDAAKVCLSLLEKNSELTVFPNEARRECAIAIRKLQSPARVAEGEAAGPEL